MVNISLLAEFSPDPYRIVRGCRYIGWNISFFVTDDIGPAVFVLVTNESTRRIVMVLSQIETVNASDDDSREFSPGPLALSLTQLT